MASVSWKPKTTSAMDTGWIKIHRKLLEWDHYRNGNTLRLFLHLLLTANIEDKEWRGIKVKRGQLVTSVAKLAYELGLTVNQVRTSKITLQNTGEITIKTTNRYTLITVCKFDDYQVQEIERPQAKPQAKPQATTHPKSQQLKNNKEEKNIKTSTKVDAKRVDFVDKEFEGVFSMWLEYKHQRRETYKSDASLKVCYNRLVNLAGGNPAVAMAIVEQSMANNWAGLFPLKNEPNNGTAINQPTGDPRQQERANLARDYAATISRRLAEDDARSGALRKP